MKIAAFLALAPLGACAVSPSNEALVAAAESHWSDERPNHIAILLGQRSLDEDDYEPVEDQIVFGFEFWREHADDVVGWEAGLQGSGDDGEIAGFDVEGSTGELYGGVRKSFGTGAIRPYVAAGLSVIRSEVEVDGFGSDDDTSLGLYAHGGVLFAVTPTFHVGLDLRGLFGSGMEIGGVDTDADYGQLALVLGFGF